MAWLHSSSVNTSLRDLRKLFVTFGIHFAVYLAAYRDKTAINV